MINIATRSSLADRYLGIDPGIGGALAWVWDNGSYIECHAIKMPKTNREILEAVGSYRVRSARIEQLTALPKAMRGSISAFKVGRNSGACIMALVAQHHPFEEVTALKWKRHFGILAKKGMTDHEKKKMGKEKAEQLFPHYRITLQLADSILIAEYARRYDGGMA